MQKVSLEQYAQFGCEAEIPLGDITAQPKLKAVFLGGTCADSKWRERLMGMLKVDAINPLTKNWSMETQELEQEAKLQAEMSIFTITPKQTGFYGFAELMTAAIKNPNGTVALFLDEDDGATFDEDQKKSVDAVKKLLAEETGVYVAKDMDDAARYINEKVGGEEATSDPDPEDKNEDNVDRSEDQEHVDSIRDRD